MSEIEELGPHGRMTPEQALAYVAREPWQDVIIVGFQKDSEALHLRSSAMTRETSLWIAEHLKMQILDL